jgi:integrase
MEGWDPMASLRKRGKVWYVRYRDPHGKQIETKAGPDKSVAQRIARELESRVSAIKAGVADPREQSWAENERKPLTDHVHDWASYLLHKGDVARHVRQSQTRVLRLIESAKIQRISGLTISTIQPALADLRSIRGRRGNARLSDRTIVYHVMAIRSFAKWLWSDGRVRDDPLVHLRMPEVKDKYVRKALEPEEIAALVSTTRTQRTLAGLTGPDRAVLYATASGTGLRLGELLSLTPESFKLDDDPPTVFCRGEHTKNGDDAHQPVRPELVNMLRPWLHGKAPGKPVFVAKRLAVPVAIREDLEAAGIAQSESYDFHCLRHSYITTLVKSGVNPKICQALARHKNINLTMDVYTHLTINDTAQGLEGLAHILPTTSVSLGLNGTDGTTVISSPGRSQVDPARQSDRTDDLNLSLQLAP